LPNQEWFIEIKEDNRVKCICLPHAWLLELGQGFVQFQGVSLEPLVKEEPEELLAKLRLLFEKVLYNLWHIWSFWLKRRWIYLYYGWAFCLANRGLNP
jgi:hypothetical protein